MSIEAGALIPVMASRLRKVYRDVTQQVIDDQHTAKCNEV
jgi:hypothetical protein